MARCRYQARTSDPIWFKVGALDAPTMGLGTCKVADSQVAIKSSRKLLFSTGPRRACRATVTEPEPSTAAKVLGTTGSDRSHLKVCHTSKCGLGL